MSSIEGHVAVVTGAAHGVGRAVTQRLAAAGIHVVGLDITDVEALPELPGPGKHLAIHCDVTDIDSVMQAQAQVDRTYGRCDVLVNNVGTYPIMPFAEVTLEDFQRVIRINVESMFLCAKAFAPTMQAAQRGRIVNIGAALTLLHSKDLLPYITSKGAVHAFTRALSCELGDSNITVNAIAPSILPTEGVFARTHGVGGVPTDQELDLVAATQTIKRQMSADDIADTVAFLISDQAKFITGQVLHVDGGLTFSGA